MPDPQDVRRRPVYEGYIAGAVPGELRSGHTCSNGPVKEWGAMSTLIVDARRDHRVLIERL